jgi:hypothetical protein
MLSLQTAPAPNPLCTCHPLLLCSSRPGSDPDKLASIEDAQEDLASDPWFANTSMAGMAAPAGMFEEPGSSGSGEAGAGPAGSAAAAAGGGAAVLSPEQRRSRLLAAAVGKWLSVYGGKHVQGHHSRPKVGGAAAAAAVKLVCVHTSWTYCASTLICRMCCQFLQRSVQLDRRLAVRLRSVILLALLCAHASNHVYCTAVVFLPACFVHLCLHAPAVARL